MEKRILLFDLPIDVFTMDQTVTLIDNSINKNKHIHHVVVNVAKVVNSQNDSELRASIINCDIINADGQAIVWASHILNKPLPERVSGIDLMEELVKFSTKKNTEFSFWEQKKRL